MASADDVVSQLQNIAQQLSRWVTAFNGRVVFGTLALTAAASTTVSQSAVQSLSYIVLIPTNTAAAALVGSSKSPYVSSVMPNTSFVVSTADGTDAAGTETFNYLMLTPM